MKKIISTVLVFLICSIGANSQLIRLVNSNAVGSTLNTKIDGVSNSSLSGLSYLDASALVRVSAGSHKISVTVGSTTRDTTLDIESGYQYTFWSLPATGTMILFTFKLAIDDYVDKGTGKIQFLHGSNTLGNVDVSKEDSRGDDVSPWQNFQFSSAQLYYAYYVGEIILRIGPNGKPPVYQGLMNNIEFNHTTAVLTGKFSDNSFKVSCLIDNDSSAQKPMKVIPKYIPMPYLRGVHLVAAAPNVDVKLDNDNAATFANVAYNQASKSVKVAAGNHQIKITGVGSNTAVASINANLNADSVYTLFATGTLPTPKSTLGTYPKKTKLTLDECWVRFLHVGTDADMLSAQIIEETSDETNIDINQGQLTPFVKLRRGTTTFDISKVSGSSIFRTEYKISGQGVYTIVLTGGGSGFGMGIITESDTNAQVPIVKLERVVLHTDFRVVNMVAGSPKAEVKFDDINEPIGAPLFREATKKVRTTVGGHTLKVMAGGIPISDLPFTLNMDSVYVLLYGGKPTQNEFFSVSIARVASLVPPSSRSMVRAVNMNSDKPSFSVTMKDKNNATLNTTSLATGRVTKFYEVLSGNVSIELSSGGTLVYRGKTLLQPNQLATLIIGGNLATTDDTQLGVSMLIETDSNAQAPMTLLTKENIVSVPLYNQIDVVLAPNPAHSLASVSYVIDQNSEIRVQLFDVTGKLILEKLESKNVGENITTLDLTNVQSGNYNVVIYKSGKIFGKQKFQVR